MVIQTTGGLCGHCEVLLYGSPLTLKGRQFSVLPLLEVHFCRSTKFSEHCLAEQLMEPVHRWVTRPMPRPAGGFIRVIRACDLHKHNAKLRMWCDESAYLADECCIPWLPLLFSILYSTLIFVLFILFVFLSLFFSILYSCTADCWFGHCVEHHKTSWILHVIRISVVLPSTF